MALDYFKFIILEEFFRQGDLEASMGLPYSPLCDRHTTHVAESQIGFIDFIVEVINFKTLKSIFKANNGCLR